MSPKPKKNALPVARTEKQIKAAEARAEKARQEKELAEAQSVAKQNAARLAQVVNLHIAGYSLAEIGASIGATADDVDRMLQNDTARYVRTQPALRTYVRNYVSGRYTKLLEAVWDEATDKHHPSKLENQDRALRILDRMAKLHGADAPVQAEVKVEANPEAVENMVKLLSAAKGVDYDLDVFDDVIDEDVIDAEVVHDAAEEAGRLLEVSGNEVEQAQEGDEDL